MAYRNEVLTLVEWCFHHTVELNVLKTKELVVDFRRKGVVSQPLSINGVKVGSFRFLGSILNGMGNV